MLISLIVFQNTFKGAIERVPELPYELIAAAGGGATPLVSTVLMTWVSSADTRRTVCLGRIWNHQYRCWGDHRA